MGIDNEDDIARNILIFLRALFEHKSIYIDALCVPLFDCVMNEYQAQNQWTDTQKLLFLWTVYEYNKNGHFEDVYKVKVLKWTALVFELQYDHLVNVFSDKCIDSLSAFSDFVFNINHLNEEDVNKMEDE